MSETDKNASTAAAGTNINAGDTAPKSIWDNDLPVGDAPPLPRWPLTASIVAYSLWMLFLISMMIVRLSMS